MRPFHKAFVIAALASMCISIAAGENVADVVKQSSDAVVLIVISNSSGQEIALGSGFLVSADGEIVTNYHVIKDAHTAVVKLSNGAFFPVNGVLASDEDKDLAIIKVNGKNLPFLQLGDVDTLHVGDHVVAIGGPLGLEVTVSDGIVSSVRDVAKMRWIQTTAPVSHGNSGGPLLDMNDHVVGVITWGVNLQLGQNLNFAAPANEVKALLSAPKTPTNFPAIQKERLAEQVNAAIWEHGLQCSSKAEHFFDENKFSDSGSASYENHFNSRLNRCFILVTVNTFVGAGFFHYKVLMDVIDAKTVAEYDKKVSPATEYPVKPFVCDILDKYCQTDEEFDAFVKSYMEN